ncbi:hypothetical protein TNCV_2240751 [Trichonephila clavipes]|nr:hypothetical protein TNCV_2240751 [Trichonephila clavipes]
MRGNLLKTELLMSKIRGAIVSMMELLDLIKNRLQFINSHISELDCLTHVKKANEIVGLFETTASAISEIANCFEIAVTGIQERVRALTNLYIATK